MSQNASFFNGSTDTLAYSGNATLHTDSSSSTICLSKSSDPLKINLILLFSPSYKSILQTLTNSQEAFGFHRSTTCWNSSNNSHNSKSSSLSNSFT